MRRIITAGVLALALSCFGLHAQDPKTDLEIDNLKGNVSKISAYTKTVIEEWGEEKEVLKSLYCSYYNEKGFFTYRQYKLDDEPFYYGGATKKYDYDASGKLVQVLFYMPKTKSNLTEINTDEPQVKAVYEYDNQGRIKYISYYQTESGTWQMSRYYRYGEFRGREIDAKDYRDEAKEIWVYTADGYKHTVCNKEGQTIKREVFTENGKKMEDDWGLSIFDNAGRLIARGGTITANNGSASYGYYYGYNKQGDLAIESNREVGQKEIDIMPWLKAEYNHHGDFFYEYTYDNHGNWINRKKFKTLNGNRKPELEEEVVRKIEYGQYGALNLSEASGSSNIGLHSSNLVIGESRMAPLTETVTNAVQGYLDATSEYVQMANEFESKKNSLTSAIRESRAERLNEVRKFVDDIFVSTVNTINYEIYDKTQDNESLDEALSTLNQILGDVKAAYPGCSLIAPLETLKEKYDFVHKEL